MNGLSYRINDRIGESRFSDPAGRVKHKERGGPECGGENESVWYKHQDILETFMIEYRESPEEISPEDLSGFFVSWPDSPSPETHLRILKESHAVILAIDDASQHVVGFVTAISDGILTAYLPLLEVLPEYQNRGIGSELVQRMLKSLSSLYMVDVVCDPKLESFYDRFGLKPRVGMVLRNYENQSGLS